MAIQTSTQSLCYDNHANKRPLSEKQENAQQVQSNAIAFPALPDESYRVSATERLTLDIPIEPGQMNSVTASSTIPLAWALVISAYTSSNDTFFGLCTDEFSKELPPARPFRVIIKPENSLRDTLTSVEGHYANTMVHDRASTEMLDRYPNVLVLRHHPHGELYPGPPSSPSFVCPLVLTVSIRQSAFYLSLDLDPEIITLILGSLVLDQLAHVLKCIHANPTGNLKTLLEIGPRSREQISLWNSRLWVHKKESRVHDVISQRCQENPLAPAVSAWDGNLTYAELEKLSTHLAARLFALNSTSERLIGLLLNKSMWTAVSILAVMKSGHAFFFLDPSLPNQRLETMCRISEAPLILTSPEGTARAAQLGPPTLVVQDECRGVTQLPPISPPMVNPHQAVYLAFTSGSSGEPKGVVIEHGAVCSGVDSYAASVGLNRQSRVFQFASYSFVISILDHLACLMHGACLCVPSAGQIQENLTRAISSFSANWVEITPSVARVLDPDALPSLQTLCLTGESMTRSDMEKWQGKVDLKTCYGQSENSLGALVDTKSASSKPIDLGYPFAANCWIVDSHNPDRLVPVGAEGELLLEGPSLARGYLRNEEQTQAAFIYNPAWLQSFRPGQSGRFLRTGDIVRYRPENGSIQYITRNGTQVKLRGQRIELAEVEFQLKKQFLAADTVITEIVTPNQERTHDAILVAFVTVTHQRRYGNLIDDVRIFASASTEFIRQSQTVSSKLHEILPKYMVPTVFVPLEILPLTPTGKLNRKLLRNKAADLGKGLQEFNPFSQKTHCQPCTENEKRIQRICAQVLLSESKDINMNSSFFEMGGNSITAAELINRAREAGFSFRAEQVFQQLSLAALAGHRGEKSTEEGVSIAEQPTCATLKTKLREQSAGCIDIDNISDIFPCTQPQQWLFDTHEGGCFLLRFSGPLDVPRLRDACRRLVEIHNALRSVFVRVDGTLHQAILHQMEIPFTIQSVRSDCNLQSAARDLCSVDGKDAFQSGTPPLQFTLVEGCAEQHMLIIQLSHAQYDGSCQERIVSDLCILYHNKQHPALPTDYGLYARQVARRQTPDSFGFWRELLAGSTITPVPSTRSLTGTETAVLNRFTEVSIGRPPSGITLASVVKAAWSKVLHDVTRSEDVVFAQLVSMRGMDVRGIYQTVGLCLNRVPVRVQYQKCATVLDLLRTIQKQHAQAVAFEAAGWDNIVSHSTTWPAGSRPQSLVIHQNFSTRRNFQMGGNVVCELVDHVAIEPPPEALELYSEPVDDRLRLQLRGPSCLIGEHELDMLLEKLCSTLVRFTTSPGIDLTLC